MAPEIVNNVAHTLVQSPTTMAPDSSLPDTSRESAATRTRTQGMTSTSVSSAKKRRPSKSASASTLKRSASTPNVRGPVTQTDIALSLAEKRRNKLGYHRTSVACVHCRRRKIRCLSAPDDPQNRCSNCIRLKKECNFYPVDQQPSQERRTRTGSKVDVKTSSNSASSSSSPGLTTGASAEHVENFNHFPLMPIATHPFTGSIIPSAGATMSPPGSAAPLSARFEFPDQQHRNQWDHHYYESPVGPTDEHASTYWMKPDTPITPSYPSYPHGMPAPLHTPIHHDSTYPPFEPTKTEPGWHPGRSMSFSQLEDSAHPPETFNHYYHPDARRNTMDMLPPSLRHSGSSSIVSISESPTTTLPAAGPMQTMVPPHTIPLPWQNSIPSQSPKNLDFGGSGGGGWYHDQGPLAKVSEEQEVPPHFVGDHPLLYTGTHH